jgi:very-short-patch-repair endonuclease
MTPEQIAAQVAAAHSATKGRKATWDERAKRAATIERNPPAMSVHEAKFARSLDRIGVPWRREVAVGIYNLDFTLGSVGVEILGGEWHAYKGERHPRRVKYILGEGWALVYVWATSNYPLTRAAAEYCVAFAQEVSRNPALRGEYRVIRGDAHLIASGRDELDEFTLEQSARNSLNLTPSEIGKMGASARYGRKY